MSVRVCLRLLACAGAGLASAGLATAGLVLAVAPAVAGSKGWINQAIESQKGPAAPAEKPAAKSPPVKSQATAQGSGGRSGDDKPPPKTGGGGFQISSSTGGGGMDEMALLGNGGGAGRSVEAGRSPAAER